MTKFPKSLLSLISGFKKLPGVGRKTAERFAFDLLNWKDEDLQEFSKMVATLKLKVTCCEECGCLVESIPCELCNTSKRDPTTLCVIAKAKDLFPIEDTKMFHGVYHVLGTLLSPLDEQTPDDLHLDKLESRIEKLGVKEIILAFDPTIEGDTTALFLRTYFEQKGILISRLALGLPLGSSLDFVDGGTLSQALLGRQKF